MWQTSTFGDMNINKFLFQRDGNLVLYRVNGSVAWAASIFGGNTLVIQDDGNLVVYKNDGVAVWSTVTYGKCPIGLLFQLGLIKMKFSNSLTFVNIKAI